MSARLSVGLLFFAAVIGWACASPQPISAPSDSSADATPSAASQATYSSEELENLKRGTRNDAWRSTYEASAAPPTVIQNATIMTAAGDVLDDADILLQDGTIAALGTDLDAPSDARVIDGQGRFVTPGLIDSHSHIGVSATPEVSAHYDNNDAGTTTPQLWIDHSVWPQGPGFGRALAGGTTTALLLPGSGDLIEGRGVTVKMVPARTPQAMMFPEAPYSLKIACGENPKGGSFPRTRMGNVAGYRAAFIRAQDYRASWDAWLADPEDDPPDRDLGMETLAGALRGDILVQVHCYRADDMTTVLQVAQEFDFDVRSFHHAVEAYKIRDMLAAQDVSASMWSDWWGFKMEAFDGIPENIPLVAEAGARAILHSDSDLGIQRLNQDAAKAMHAGRRAGIDISRDEALRWITAHPAWALGISHQVGTLEVGKNADVVLWSGDPFSVYTHADQVWIDGVLRYDRTDPHLQPRSDFEIGLLDADRE
jgi:imidazolonepropionase-like amidohydrolase